jgi:hypothetical protein
MDELLKKKLGLLYMGIPDFYGVFFKKGAHDVAPATPTLYPAPVNLADGRDSYSALL